MAIAFPLRPTCEPAASGPRRAALTAVPDPPSRRRLPRARSVAAYSWGATAGFLLAAIASAPGGDAVVTGQLELAGASAVVTAVAALRARVVARRRRRPIARRA